MDPTRQTLGKIGNVRNHSDHSISLLERLQSLAGDIQCLGIKLRKTFIQKQCVEPERTTVAELRNAGGKSERQRERSQKRFAATQRSHPTAFVRIPMINYLEIIALCSERIASLTKRQELPGTFVAEQLKRVFEDKTNELIGSQ